MESCKREMPMVWNGKGGGKRVPFHSQLFCLFLIMLLLPGNLQRKGTFLRMVSLCSARNNLCVIEEKLVELHGGTSFFTVVMFKGCLDLNKWTPFN